MSGQRPQGNFIQADFFDLLGGLNTTDSPFKVQPTQAASGYNYDYLATGGINKRNGHTLLNSTPDAQLQSLGLGLWQSSTTSTVTKQLIRFGGVKVQEVNTSTGACTTVSFDSGASTTVFTTTSPVVSSPFGTTSYAGTWLTGGGYANGVLGYIQPSGVGKLTVNGMRAPGGSVGLAASGSDGTIPAGTYRYACALVKAHTGAVSNATFDTTVAIGSTNHVTIDLTTVTDPNSNAAYVRIYRSVISGASGFTTGDLVATVAFGTASYSDTGAVQGTAAAVPRAANTSLDNSVLGSGTYATLTTFKRRLVTSSGSTVYFSDQDKPESWPSANFITIPTGGNITALGVVSFNTPTTSSTDEFLAVFKERELWIITGSSMSDYVLKFVDFVGCPAQPLIVTANGFLFWLDYRGIYLWDGANKPIYISRLIESDFGPLGDIDRSTLTGGCGAFYRKQNQVIWFLSSISLGTQKLALKLDLRLTLPGVASALAGRTLEGVFSKDALTYPVYACASTLPTYDEILYAGDNAGYILKLFDNLGSVDGATALSFSYRTRPEDFGTDGTAKRYHKVIAWCRESTTESLTLNYWVSYKNDDALKATQSAQIAERVTSGIWDQSNWDQFYWDQVLPTYTPVVFNLGNATIGVEGDCLTLEFAQDSSGAPVTIGGYSVLYTIAGLRK